MFYPDGKIIDNPLDPVINVDDIGRALANKCRFNGLCEPFYSVAQHSVLLWEATKEPWALFHDASEAYLPDIPFGMKNDFEICGKPFREVEDVLLQRIADHVGVSVECMAPWDEWLGTWETMCLYFNMDGLYCWTPEESYDRWIDAVNGSAG